MTATTASPGAAARTAWLAIGAIASVLALAYGVLSVVGLLAWDRYHVHQSFDGPVRRLVVESHAGSVRIRAGEADHATVDSRIIRGIGEPDHEARLDGDVLRVDTSCGIAFSSYCDVTSTITVPRGVDIEVRASGGGVRVLGIDGDLDLDSSGGGVRVEGGGGPLRLRSSGGGITAVGLDADRVDASSSGGGVRLEFTDPPIDVRGRSSGGGITVVLPRGSRAYRVDASSSGGGVHDDVRSDPTSSHVIDVSSSGGGVTVRYPD